MNPFRNGPSLVAALKTTTLMESSLMTRGILTSVAIIGSCGRMAKCRLRRTMISSWLRCVCDVLFFSTT
eukprot:1183900-Prorocentrum_minimum.AAC.8